MDPIAAYWDLFLQTGAPQAYLVYKQQVKDQINTTEGTDITHVREN